MKIRIAVISVVLLLAVSSLAMAYEKWTTNWKNNNVTATIHYVDTSGKRIIRSFVGKLNNFEIDRDNQDHQFVWLFSTNETGFSNNTSASQFTNSSSMIINVNAIGSGLSSPSGMTAILATGAAPNLYKNSTSIPLTLQFTPNIFMSERDVKSVLIKGSYSINNILHSCSPILHLYVTGILTVDGDPYPAFITLSTGAANLPSAMGDYPSISSNTTPGPPPLGSGSVVAAPHTYNLTFGNSTTFNILKDSGATSSGGTNLLVYIEAIPGGTPINTIGSLKTFNGTASVTGSQNISYTPKSGFSGNDVMYYYVQSGIYASPVYPITVKVGPAPMAIMPTLEPVEMEKNSSMKIDLINGQINGQSIEPYISNWNKSFTLAAGAPLHGTLSPNATPTNPYIYTPNRDFSGMDYFYFKITKGTWTSAPGTFAVKVRPIAYDDYTTIHTTNSFGMNLLANDDTFETPTMAKIFRIYSSGMHGTVTLNNTSSVIIPNITYTPNSTPGVFGNYTDTFAYTIKDSAGQTSTALVKIRTQ